MEPMTLGSPSSLSGSNAAIGSGSGGAGGPGYLPSFLMGDPPAAPRPNTLSPTRARASLAYGGLAGSPPDSMRSPTSIAAHHQHQQQQHHFVQPQHQQQQQQQQMSSSFMNVTPHTQHFLHMSTMQASSLANQFRNESFDANASITGPPTQGLFDSWRKEKQMLHTTARGATGAAGATGGVLHPAATAGAEMTGPNQSFNESIANQSGFNVSRVMSPIPVDYSRMANVPVSPPSTPFAGHPPLQVQQQPSQPSLPSNGNVGTSNWITVFGFPQNASTLILSHFVSIGTIVDKQFAAQNGNWVHLRYSSRLECIRALNYNGRIISPGLMVGVQYCNDPAIIGKENEDEGCSPTYEKPDNPLTRVRSLVNMSYTAEKEANAVATTAAAQKRSNGIVHKAMDLFFGW
uniref:Nucleoporin NUP35 n=1 Tax=Anopheles albimanus TaxID=7167 RepID=A0A182F6B2_ANOAL